MEFQIKWELAGIDMSDLVIVYFADTSKTPITFLELGTILANRRRVVIYCSNKFYRYTNVKVTAEHYGKKITETYEDFLLNVNCEILNNVLYKVK